MGRVSHGRRRDVLSFFATGIERSYGGVQMANRNVLAGLERVAEELGLTIDVQVLHEEPDASDGRTRHGGNRLSMARAIVAGLIRSRVAVFDHVHLARPLAYVRAIPRDLRAKTVIFGHGSEAWTRVRADSRKAFRAADLVLTNSHYTLRNMRDRIPEFNGAACPLGLPPHVALTAAPGERKSSSPVILEAADGTVRPPGPRSMLLVGRMNAHEQEKGHRELLAAMPQVLKRVPEADLVLVGSGTDFDSLRSIAASSTAAGNVFLPGRVDDALLERLYSTAYAYVMPSRQEGFGLVYLEAMNHALPCVACRDDGAADVVLDGQTGVLIDQPVQIDALADSLCRLLSSPNAPANSAMRVGTGCVANSPPKHTRSACRPSCSIC